MPERYQPFVQRVNVSGERGVYRVHGWASSEEVGRNYVDRVVSSPFIDLSTLDLAADGGGAAFTARLRFNVDASRFPEGDLEEVQVDVGKDGLDPEAAALLMHDLSRRLSHRGRCWADSRDPSQWTIRDVPDRVQAARRYVEQRGEPEAPVLARMQWFRLEQAALQLLGLPDDPSESTVSLTDADVRRIATWVDEACSQERHGCKQLLRPSYNGMDPSWGRGFGIKGDDTAGGGMDWVVADREGPSTYGPPARAAIRLEWTVRDRSGGPRHHGPVPKGGAAATVLPASEGSASQRQVVIVSTRLLQPLPRWKE
jgi:hypothetical protein